MAHRVDFETKYRLIWRKKNVFIFFGGLSEQQTNSCGIAKNPRDELISIYNCAMVTYKVQTKQKHIKIKGSCFPQRETAVLTQMKTSNEGLRGVRLICVITPKTIKDS